MLYMDSATALSCACLPQAVGPFSRQAAFDSESVDYTLNHLVFELAASVCMEDLPAGRPVLMFLKSVCTE
jgi:hypothetical protein